MNSPFPIGDPCFLNAYPWAPGGVAERMISARFDSAEVRGTGFGSAAEWPLSFRSRWKLDLHERPQYFASGRSFA